MNKLLKVEDLRIATIKYFSEENNGIELTDPIGYVILGKIGEAFYVNIFDDTDLTPVFERVPYSNTTMDGEDYGSKVRLVTNKSESGPCYVVTKMDLRDYFDKDVVEKNDLEEFMLKSKYYFVDRQSIALERFKDRPIQMLKVLANDKRRKKEFVKFFEERDFVVLKKVR